MAETTIPLEQQTQKDTPVSQGTAGQQTRLTMPKNQTQEPSQHSIRDSL